MRVKELQKTVNVAWSPQAQHPILLAAGTAAQQLDASFSTNASLDLYSLNLQQPGYDMKLNISVPSDQRFHKIIWGAYGNNPAGIIVGGCDYGKIKIYNAAKMLSNDLSNCLISSPDRHKGPVRAMDFNPFQSNLLATGATESEIYIWDLNNTNQPMSPGSKSLPAEDVQYIAWNRQVQHILASTFSQRCVIWDLKKNEAIIKLSDANARVRWKSVQWHPDVATQLCLASEDDQAPLIELWDLRFATSPLKTLHNHQRGILSIAWNTHDSDLLLSCAKDNRILCWNPNSDAPNGEVICELAQTTQWNFDVSWCPRHPGLIVGTSFDGLATVYSLLGGHNQGSLETSNKIVDSFPGMDPFTQPPPQVQTEAAAILKKAPKWLKKPFGASFGFGGKLTIFENEPVDPNMPPNSNKKVFISQVITNPELIKRSNELENALKTAQYGDFCKGKIDSASDEHKQKVWSCIGAYFSDDVTESLLGLLGFNIDEINNKLNNYIPQDVAAITDGVANLNNGVNGNPLDPSAAFEVIAAQEQNKKSLPSKSIDSSFKINTSDDDDGRITQAILSGNIEAAVALCLENKRYADAIILSMAGGPDLLAQTQYKYFTEHSGALHSLINSVVSENWVDVVRNCDITCWKEALFGVFNHTSPEERSALCDILGDRLAASDNVNLKKDAQFCYICSGNLNKTIEVSDCGIQETVELVTILQKALELQNKTVNIEGNIASVLTSYAEMLAAEGDLEAALSYLGNSQEPRIAMLRDRLYKALGHVQIENQHSNVGRNAPYQQNPYMQNQSLPRKSLPGTVQNVYTPTTPGPQHPSSALSQPPVWNTAPTKQSFGALPGQSYGGVITNQPYGNSISTAPGQFNPTVPAPPLQNQPLDPYAGSYGQSQAMSPSVPPPPPTASQTSNLSTSRPPSVGPLSKSKYILDPSVKSGPVYGSPGYSQSQQMYGSPQPASFPSPGGFPAQSPYQPQQPQQMGSYGSYNSNVAQNTFYNPAEPELQQSRKMSQPSLLNPAPVKPQPLYDPNSVVQTPQQNVSNMGSAPPPPQSGFGTENMYQPGSQASGWNDPPISKTNKPQQKSEFQRQDPILHPLRTAAPQPEPNMYQQDPGYQQQQQQNYQNPQTMYNQFNQNIPSQGLQQFNRIPEPAPVQPAQIVRAPEPEKPKAPLPEKHKQLQIIFNELKDRCLENAKSSQDKRKLDDVSKKLEVLYDCLRENKISQNTLQGLHQISNLIQNGNYPEGLTVHTQLVSSPDFSQIASFMPGIKVLLQSALRLDAYIR